MAVTGGLAPNQRPMIAKLGLKALLAGSLANLMSAALAGLLLPLTASVAGDSRDLGGCSAGLSPARDPSFRRGDGSGRCG